MSKQEKPHNFENNRRIVHPFGPLFNENSHVLILGSFPSVKSREQEFFYGHPQNRFWKVIAALFTDSLPHHIGKVPGYDINKDRMYRKRPGTGAESSNSSNSSNTELRLPDQKAAEKGIVIPLTIEEKKSLILNNGLALWDSIGSCEITGSSDASIRNAEPNDISIITGSCDIRAIYCNGKKSLEVYNKYIRPQLGRDAEALPSTSPANAAWSLERLIEAWAVIRKDV